LALIMLIRIVLLILLWGSSLTPAAFAFISLSVVPVDGSNSLRFENMPVGGLEDRNEIHIRVNSSDGRQYQVFQRILEPVVNEKGDALNLQAMETQTLPNSNSSGTLYLQNSDHLSMGDQLLYSSSQAGESDMFMIGYFLNQGLINAVGSFRGRMIFTVRDVSGNSDQATIDIFMDASSNLKVSVKGAHDPIRIHVRSSDTTEKEADYVNLSFSGNSGQDIRIYQEVEIMPQNGSGRGLGGDVLQLDAESDDAQALRIQGLNSLRDNKTLIYSSNKDADNFVIYFLVDSGQIQQQDAGSYIGRIKYIVETSRGAQEFPIDIQCDVPPEFSISITPPPGGVNFTHVLANNPPQDKQVLVTVTSNLHKPYQVLQDLQTNMTDNQGKEFDNKYFTIQVQIPSGQEGQTNFTEFSPMETGEYPIFSSDAGGSSATFEVVYRLQGYDRMSPGNFLAPVRFSLDQK